jgi:arabinogalactan endo-1,4-beta-galactosidase
VTVRRFVPLILAATSASASAAAPFLMGGDVSLLPFLENNGASYRDGGIVTPAERIMANHGANVFRLRLFVNPNPNYSATAGAIQDLNYTIALAQRIKASGAKVLLDFHYSDTWADPGKQNKPAAWSSLTSAQLVTKVRDYTRDSLQAFRVAGASPDLVQIGNETTSGMLWTNGKVVYTGSTATQNASWAAFGSFLNAGIAGVRDVDAETGKHTQVAIHVDGGDVNGRAQYYFNQLATVGGVSPSSYDIAGLSFYPTTTAAFTNLQGNLNYAANTLGRQAMVLETNAPWKGTATGSGYAATATGQKDQLTAVRDMIKNLPNDRGLGVVWWYPEAVQTGGLNIWKGGAIALFDDSGGDALPALDTFQFAAPTWTVDADASWGTAVNWATGLPDGVGVTARFGTAISAPRTISLDAARTVGTLRFQSDARYTLAGSQPLTLNNGANVARIDVLAGNHTIDAQMTITGNTEVNAAWTSTLSLTKPIAAAGRVTKLGSGTAAISQARVAGALDVSCGTVRFTEKPVNTAIASAIIGGLEVAPLATLDLTNNTLVIDPATGIATDAMVQSIRQSLVSGRIVSSLATAHQSIGYAIDKATDRAAFDGLTIDASSLVLRLTLKGDADVDGDVDFADLVVLAQSYNTVGEATWQRGDFSYDGNIDFADLVVLAQHYGGNLGLSESPGGSDSFATDWALAQVLVPEPSALFIVAQAFLPVMLRRRNRPAADTGRNACAT